MFVGIEFFYQVACVLCRLASCTGCRQEYSVDIANSTNRKRISDLELSLLVL